MNPWYFEIGLLCLLLLLAAGLLVCIALFVKHRIQKQRNRSITVSIVINVVFIIIVMLYAASHPTYYKFNDWVILQSNIHMVEQKYGAFDLGTVRDNEKGKVAYYIYTDNGPIMPDHLKHYYYMEYDEWGIIYDVYEQCQPGG